MTGTGSSTGTSSTGGDRLAHAGIRDSDCSSTIGMSGWLTAGSPYGTAGPTPGHVGEQVVDELRAGRAEAVEGGVAGQPDRARAEQAGDRRRSMPVRSCPTWKRSSRAYTRSIAGGAAEREQVARDERPVGQPGQRRVDGVAPPEGAELLARQLQDPVPPATSASSAATAAFHAAGTSWSRSIAGSTSRRPVSDRQVGERQQPDGDRGDRPPRSRTRGDGRRTRERVDQAGGAEGEPEDEQRHGPRARAQGERGAGRPVAEQGVHQRRRVVDRVDADPEHDAGRRRAAMANPRCAPARGHEPGEGDEQRATKPVAIRRPETM